MGHGGHPEGVRGLGDGGHGEPSRGRGDDGRRREGDHPGQGDVVHDKGVVAVVEGTKVATDTEALFCESKQQKVVKTKVNPHPLKHSCYRASICVSSIVDMQRQHT